LVFVGRSTSSPLSSKGFDLESKPMFVMTCMMSCGEAASLN
jgi:hypothetical protein